MKRIYHYVNLFVIIGYVFAPMHRRNSFGLKTIQIMQIFDERNWKLDDSSTLNADVLQPGCTIITMF